MSAKTESPHGAQIALRGGAKDGQAGERTRRDEERRSDRRRRVDEKEGREGDARQRGVDEEHQRRSGRAHAGREGAERDDQPDLREEQPIKEDPVLEEPFDDPRRVGDTERDDPRGRQTQGNPPVRHPERVTDAVARRDNAVLGLRIP